MESSRRRKCKTNKNFNTQKEAIEYAKTIAKNQKSELIVQKVNGQIGIKNTYGKDPNPKEYTKLVIFNKSTGEEIAVITNDLITTATDNIVVKLTPTYD